MKDIPNSRFRPVNLLSSPCHIHIPSISSDKRRAAATTWGKSHWSFLVLWDVKATDRGPVAKMFPRKTLKFWGFLGEYMWCCSSDAFLCFCVFTNGVTWVLLKLFISELICHLVNQYESHYFSKFPNCLWFRAPILCHFCDCNYFDPVTVKLSSLNVLHSVAAVLYISA